MAKVRSNGIPEIAIVGARVVRVQESCGEIGIQDTNTWRVHNRNGKWYMIEEEEGVAAKEYQLQCLSLDHGPLARERSLPS